MQRNEHQNEQCLEAPPCYADPGVSVALAAIALACQVQGARAERADESVWEPLGFTLSDIGVILGVACLWECLRQVGFLGIKRGVEAIMRFFVTNRNPVIPRDPRGCRSDPGSQTHELSVLREQR